MKSQRRGTLVMIACGLVSVTGAFACHQKEIPQAKATPVVDTLTAADSTDLNALGKQIARMVGDAGCDDASQCRLIAYGSKACGGPRKYLVYSVRNTDSVALAAAVGRLNAREAEINRSEGRVSDCSMVTRPQIKVVDGRCTID